MHTEEPQALPTVDEIEAALQLITRAVGGYGECDKPIAVVWENGIQFHDNRQFVASGYRSVAKKLLIKGVEKQ